MAQGTRLGGATGKNTKKLSQKVFFFVYFDEKFDNINNFFQRNTGNYKFFKNLQNQETSWQNRISGG